jgi:transcriptional regulator with XRE-family HTH domain
MSKTAVIYMQPDEARAIREGLAWTMETAAKELGIRGGRANYYQYETGRKPISFQMAELYRAYAAGYRRSVT